MNKITTTIAVIALIIGIGIGYAGAGMLHPATSATSQAARGNYTGIGGGASATRASASGGLLSGTVSSKDSGSITVDTRDGSSHVVLVTPDTTVSKSVNGSASDISVGSAVMVSGATNSDGSVSASVVQLRPAAPQTAPQPQ